jgi:hypothetical protein
MHHIDVTRYYETMPKLECNWRSAVQRNSSRAVCSDCRSNVLSNVEVEGAAIGVQLAVRFDLQNPSNGIMNSCLGL